MYLLTECTKVHFNTYADMMKNLTTTRKLNSLILTSYMKAITCKHQTFHSLRNFAHRQKFVTIDKMLAK